MRRILLLSILLLSFAIAAQAQVKISALPSGTPAATDIMPYVANPAGTAATKQTSVSSLFSILTPSLLGSSNVNGNGAKFQLFTGTFAANDCAKFDSAGNIVSAGAACGSGAGARSPQSLGALARS